MLPVSPEPPTQASLPARIGIVRVAKLRAQHVSSTPADLVNATAIIIGRSTSRIQFNAHSAAPSQSAPPQGRWVANQAKWARSNERMLLQYGGARHVGMAETRFSPPIVRANASTRREARGSSRLVRSGQCRSSRRRRVNPSTSRGRWSRGRTPPPPRPAARSCSSSPRRRPRPPRRPAGRPSRAACPRG
jgi:hypothetical protein